ncbi:MAG TPA: prolipoprotein diacylglyceryl transferase [Candidatus Latescibacteria bacterium]|nr:prolipoprotein diacylglyceryl transferase [Candidatus Latescibacterota bacterium]
MFPILFKIGPIVIHTYGVLHALGFLVAVWVAVREARKVGVAPGKMLDLSTWAIISSLVGARIFFILFDGHLGFYLEHPSQIFKVWQGGLTYYGGFTFGLGTSLWYIRKHKMKLGATLDAGFLGVPLGAAVSRLGCFASGDSYGKPTDLPWGVIYSDPHSLAPTGVALHPTQLYSVVGNLLIFLVLIRLRNRKRFDGQLTLAFVFLYGVVRSILEIFRADPGGRYFGGLISTPQLMSIPLVLVAAYFYRKLGTGSYFRLMKRGW